MVQDPFPVRPAWWGNYNGNRSGIPLLFQQRDPAERLVYQRGIGPKTQRWTELSDTTTRSFENEELILRNTYLNS